MELAHRFIAGVLIAFIGLLIGVLIVAALPFLFVWIMAMAITAVLQALAKVVGK